MYQLATELRLTGWVNNGAEGVRIIISGEEDNCSTFLNRVVNDAPPLSSITNHSFAEEEFKEFADFSINNSEVAQGINLPLTPDFALCDDCRKDIRETNNRRKGYAFTTCTNCGPRYSIIRQMPYDRPFTTMGEFTQCLECQAEYDNPLNRRHFSQTNSCDLCGIDLYTNNGQVDIDFIVEKLREGSILAVKGIGGYLLITDASNSKAIAQLRERKNRPTKPFAVMYPDIVKIKAEYEVRDVARKLLQSEVSPIILLKQKNGTTTIDVAGIAPGLNKIGCMIPYAPIFQLILDSFGKPIIATSGNVSGSPIIYENAEAEDELSTIADFIISNNRDIVIPQDDSVLSFSGPVEQQIILRRSRGLAPSMLDHKLPLNGKNVLAMGADMKAAFALTHHEYAYVSQYLGDMDSYLTQKHFEKTLAHLSTVLDHQPEIVLVDKHPGYFSTGLGKQKAEENNLPFHEIQHHKAHFYAVLAENELLNVQDSVLGVIWDGTGYGDDGMIWGGEFFVFEDKKVKREEHLPYFPFILGDKMPREPRIGALAVGKLLGEEIPEIANKFTDAELQLYQPMLASPTLQTSSIGRLFDAVASLVLGIDKTSYEGEAAMMLEAAALSAAGTGSAPETVNNDYLFPIENYTVDLFSAILKDLRNGLSTTTIALKFHYSLVTLIRQVAKAKKAKKMAFSGGVFQNSLLVELILEELSGDFKLYFHKQLSPNDENISYGQLAWYTLHEKQLSR